MKGFLSLALVLGLCACSGDTNPVPEPLTGTIPKDPRSCADIRAGEVVNEQILVDGAAAECVGEGVTCGVSDQDAFANVCKLGLPNAECHDNLWRILCDLDAGTAQPTDAGAE